MAQTEQGILLNAHLVNRMKVGGELGWFPREFNTSTGYKWSCTVDNSGVYEWVDTVTLHPATDAVGVPGMLLWKFKAVKPGKGSIKFELYRPGQEKPIEDITVEIQVN